MLCCTFFGHRNCPQYLRDKLKNIVRNLIENHNVCFYYIGNHGQFDAMAHSVVRELQKEYPQIGYTVVLAYMPQEKQEEYFSDTMLPEGIECVPKRFAISWRNQWMLEHSDYVVTYITHSCGGAAQFAKKAKRKKKNVINLGAVHPVD